MARNRSNVISTIRMNDEEYAQYLNRLKKANISGNEFGIRCLLDKPIIVIENMPEILMHLKKLGNNLNQLKRNSKDGQNNHPVVEELEKGVDEFWQLLSQLKSENH